jgi:hypothetical protein
LKQLKSKKNGTKKFKRSKVEEMGLTVYSKTINKASIGRCPQPSQNCRFDASVSVFALLAAVMSTMQQLLTFVKLSNHPFHHPSNPITQEPP